MPEGGLFGKINGNVLRKRHKITNLMMSLRKHRVPLFGKKEMKRFFSYSEDMFTLDKTISNSSIRYLSRISDAKHKILSENHHYLLSNIN
jgi:hypothetical protein